MEQGLCHIKSKDILKNWSKKKNGFLGLLITLHQEFSTQGDMEEKFQGYQGNLKLNFYRITTMQEIVNRKDKIPGPATYDPKIVKDGIPSVSKS